MHLLERVKNRLFMKTRTKAFRQWSSNTKQLKHERTITMKFVQRMRYLKVSQTMERWKDNVQDRKRARYVLRSLSIKLRARNLSKGWYVCVYNYEAQEQNCFLVYYFLILYYLIFLFFCKKKVYRLTFFLKLLSYFY